MKDFYRYKSLVNLKHLGCDSSHLRYKVMQSQGNKKVETNKREARRSTENTVAETRVRRHIHRLQTSRPGEMVPFRMESNRCFFFRKRGEYKIFGKESD